MRTSENENYYTISLKLGSSEEDSALKKGLLLTQLLASHQDISNEKIDATVNQFFLYEEQHLYFKYGLDAEIPFYQHSDPKWINKPKFLYLDGMEARKTSLSQDMLEYKETHYGALLTKFYVQLYQAAETQDNILVEMGFTSDSTKTTWRPYSILITKSCLPAIMLALKNEIPVVVVDTKKIPTWNAEQNTDDFVQWGYQMKKHTCGAIKNMNFQLQRF